MAAAYSLGEPNLAGSDTDSDTFSCLLASRPPVHDVRQGIRYFLSEGEEYDEIAKQLFDDGERGSFQHQFYEWQREPAAFQHGTKMLAGYIDEHYGGDADAFFEEVELHTSRVLELALRGTGGRWLDEMPLRARMLSYSHAANHVLRGEPLDDLPLWGDVFLVAHDIWEKSGCEDAIVNWAAASYVVVSDTAHVTYKHTGCQDAEMNWFVSQGMVMEDIERQHALRRQGMEGVTAKAA